MAANFKLSSRVLTIERSTISATGLCCGGGLGATTNMNNSTVACNTSLKSGGGFSSVGTVTSMPRQLQHGQPQRRCTQRSTFNLKIRSAAKKQTG
jgi:hypothetical protein